MPTYTNPRRRQPRMQTSISVRVPEAESFRSIVRATGMRHDTAFAALLRLFNMAPESLRCRAGFPVPAHDGPVPEAHEAPNPTIGAGA